METVDNDSRHPPSDWVDKRSDERAAITLRVDYKRLNTFFGDYAKNISKGGTFIRTSRPLEVGTEFVFVLSLPTPDTQLQLNGAVVWIVKPDEASNDRPAGMGIKFKFETDAERASVHDFVERLMTETLGAHLSSKLLGQK